MADLKDATFGVEEDEARRDARCTRQKRLKRNIPAMAAPGTKK
jgi:hypothetical protein